MYSISACSVEEVGISDTSTSTALSFKSYNYTRFNIPDSTVRDSTHFVLSNNRILTASSVVSSNSSPAFFTRTYDYSNDRIATINIFQEGSLLRKREFSYDTNGKLITFTDNIMETVNQAALISRHTFTHTTDTIFGVWEQTTGESNTSDLVAAIKIVLDANQNRTYAEVFNQQTNDSTITLNSYDENNNMITDNSFKIRDGVPFENNLNTFSYSESANPLALINEATFTRENLMILYYLQDSAINGFTPRMVSPHLMDTFTSNFSNTFRFDIRNNESLNGKKITNEFLTFANDDLLLLFTTTFTIEE